MTTVSANCRYSISDDPRFRVPGRACGRVPEITLLTGCDSGLPHRLHRIIHCRSHRCTDFPVFRPSVASPLTGVGIPWVTGDSARLRLFYGSDLYPSLGKDFRLGLRFRFFRARGMSRFTGGWRSCSLRGFRAGCSSSWRTGDLTGRAGLLTTLLRFPLPPSAPVFAVVQAGAVSLFLFPGRAVRSSHRFPRAVGAVLGKVHRLHGQRERHDPQSGRIPQAVPGGFAGAAKSSDDQVAKVNSVMDETRMRFRATRATIEPEMRKIREDQQREISELLSPDQQAEWQKIAEERERNRKNKRRGRALRVADSLELQDGQFLLLGLRPGPRGPWRTSSESGPRGLRCRSASACRCRTGGSSSRFPRGYPLYGLTA